MLAVNHQDRDTLKNKIKNCFNEAWRTYDDYCLIQNAVCLKSIEIISRYGLNYSIIADFACGTGVSTQHLINHIEYDKLYAIDFSEKLLVRAKEKCSGTRIEFILSDFDASLFPKNHLDLVFCNMGLQWAFDLKHTLKIFNSYLKESGTLVFAMPVHGTFSEIKQCYRNPFYQLRDIQWLLQQCCYEFVDVQHQVYVEQFKTQIAAVRSIKSVGANCSMFVNRSETGILSKRALEDLFVSKEDVTLTYHVGIFVAKKVTDSS